jgi:hypothetical protein
MERQKNEKKVIIVFLLISIPLALYFSIGGFPIVFNDEKEILNFEKNYENQFNPFYNADFNSGKNKVILLFSFEDINKLPQKIYKRRVLACSDNEVLRQLKNNFTFEVSGGDMATVTSEIIVFKDDKIILHTNFVLDNHSNRNTKRKNRMVTGDKR